MPKTDENRCAPLDTWLAKREAIMLWETSMHGTAPRVQAWNVQSATGCNNLIIVLRHGYQGQDGWDIFTSHDSNSTALSLEDADQRLGLTT